MLQDAPQVEPESESPRRDAVLVTGAGGRLGQRLVRQLHRRRKVIALDRRPFVQRPKDVEGICLDFTRKRVHRVFRRPEIEAIVHLGVMHDPRRGGEAHHEHNVVALQRLLDGASRNGVRKVVVLSSSDVYGPRPDNPQFLPETAPLLGASQFSEMRDLVELDLLAERRLWQEASLEIVILRPVNVLGNVSNAASNYLRLQRPPTLLGFDPMVQVVHQDDLVQALMLALEPGVKGVFNIAGPPPAPLSKLLGLLGRQPLPVPYKLARAALSSLFHLRVSSFPAPELDFLRYVCMVDDQKARRELGYRPRVDLARTLRVVDEERWV